MATNKPKRSRRVSLVDNKDALSIFDLGDLGESHESYEKLSKKKELKIRRASSSLSILQPKNTTMTTSSPSQKKLRREEETRREIEQELLRQQKERGSLSKFQGVQDPQEFLDSPEFERGLNLYFETIDQNNKKKREFARIWMLCLGIFTSMFILLFLLFFNYGYQEMEPVIGVVTTRVSGVALARSPLMSTKDALVYDRRDLVVSFFFYFNLYNFLINFPPLTELCLVS